MSFPGQPDSPAPKKQEYTPGDTAPGDLDDKKFYIDDPAEFNELRQHLKGVDFSDQPTTTSGATELTTEISPRPVAITPDKSNRLAMLAALKAASESLENFIPPAPRAVTLNHEHQVAQEQSEDSAYADTQIGEDGDTTQNTQGDTEMVTLPEGSTHFHATQPGEARDTIQTTEWSTVRDPLRSQDPLPDGSTHFHATKPGPQNLDEIPTVRDMLIQTPEETPAQLSFHTPEDQGADSQSHERIVLGKTPEKYDPTNAIRIAGAALNRHRKEDAIKNAGHTRDIAQHFIDLQEEKRRGDPDFADTMILGQDAPEPVLHKRHPLRSRSLLRNIGRLTTKLSSAFSAFRNNKIDHRTKMALESEMYAREDKAREIEEKRKQDWGDYKDEANFDAFFDKNIGSPEIIDMPTLKRGAFSKLKDLSLDQRTKSIVENEIAARKEKDTESKEEGNDYLRRNPLQNIEGLDPELLKNSKQVDLHTYTKEVRAWQEHYKKQEPPKKTLKGKLFSVFSKNKPMSNADIVMQREMQERSQHKVEQEEIEENKYGSIFVEKKPEFRLSKDTLIRIALGKLTKKTAEKREVVQQKLGPEGKKFLDKFDKAAHFIEKYVGAKTRLTIGIALSAAGVIGLSAFPVMGTVAVFTAAGIGVRVAGASAAYVGIKRLMDGQINKEEKRNQNRSDKDPLKDMKFTDAEKTAFALAGAVGAAIVGQLAAEYLAKPLFDVLAEYVPLINDTLFNFGGSTPNLPSVPEVLHAPANVPIPEMTIIPPTPPVELPNIVDTLVTSIPKESLHPTLLPGESLWSVIKHTMEQYNFDGFNDISDAQLKNAKIMEALSKLPASTDAYTNINQVQAGKIVDLTKAFTK